MLPHDPSSPDPRQPHSGLGPGMFGHHDGRLDVLERRDRFQVFARLPETDADGVRVTFEQGALTILARRDGGDRPMGWGVRLVFGDQVVGSVRSVLEGELLLVELPKTVVGGGPSAGPSEPGGASGQPGGWQPGQAPDADAWLDANLGPGDVGPPDPGAAPEADDDEDFGLFDGIDLDEIERGDYPDEPGFDPGSDAW